MKTVSVALVMCLNVGVDPPDVVKTSPCARKECWIGKVFKTVTVQLSSFFDLILVIDIFCKQSLISHLLVYFFLLMSPS